ncbi:hypothetical protein GRX03_11260 [Halovenus sp. WSH3]|uniref:Lipoprotein n=1 Tax=Halovenus carboxidivorans TaxID=2692199 RepID=A0A6B0T7J1_9EURY|nr:hypothetical protein [Halovenus carboxidivorans]MXR52176.1 hypothetical protein [Halovenus carboxidivorans]
MESRRTVVHSCLAAVTLGIAGCTGGPSETDDEPEQSAEELERLRAGDRVLNSSFPMEIYEPDTDTRLVQIHWHGKLSNSHWHQQPLDVPLDRWKTYEMRALDRDGQVIQLGASQPLQLSMRKSPETAADLLDSSIDGNLIDLRGRDRGRGAYAFQLVSGEQVEWESPLLQLSVE